MDEREAHQWFVQIAQGLKYLHNKNVIHLDIKTHNILYKVIANKRVFKSSNFGISRIFEAGIQNPKALNLVKTLFSRVI